MFLSPVLPTKEQLSQLPAQGAVRRRRYGRRPSRFRDVCQADKKSDGPDVSSARDAGSPRKRPRGRPRKKAAVQDRAAVETEDSNAQTALKSGDHCEDSNPSSNIKQSRDAFGDQQCVLGQTSQKKRRGRRKQLDTLAQTVVRQRIDNAGCPSELNAKMEPFENTVPMTLSENAICSDAGRQASASPLTGLQDYGLLTSGAGSDVLLPNLHPVRDQTLGRTNRPIRCRSPVEQVVMRQSRSQYGQMFISPIGQVESFENALKGQESFTGSSDDESSQAYTGSSSHQSQACGCSSDGTGNGTSSSSSGSPHPADRYISRSDALRHNADLVEIANHRREDRPLYVNAKQYERIIKRRQARARLELEGRIPERRKQFMHKSRHEHALKRIRGEDGRFAPGSRKVPDHGRGSRRSKRDKSKTGRRHHHHRHAPNYYLPSHVQQRYVNQNRVVTSSSELQFPFIPTVMTPACLVNGQRPQLIAPPSDIRNLSLGTPAPNRILIQQPLPEYPSTITQLGQNRPLQQGIMMGDVLPVVTLSAPQQGVGSFATNQMPFLRPTSVVQGPAIRPRVATRHHVMPPPNATCAPPRLHKKKGNP